MKRMLLSVLVILALAVVAVPVLAQDALQVGTTEGSLKAGATAVYTLDAAAGDVYLIGMSSADFDTYVEVTDANGFYVTSDDDSGVDRNSLAVFVAGEAGTYTVNARSFDSSAEGAFTLTVSNDVTTLAVGTPVPVTVDGISLTVFSLTVEAGAYTISANSESTVDTSLTLYDTTGLRLDSADDVLGVDPAFQRRPLDAGTYFVLLTPYSESAIGETTVLVEATELRILGAEPTTLVFDENTREDTGRFTVEAGKVYLITVSLDVADDFNMNMESADDTQYTYGNFSFTQGLGGTFLYQADITGDLNVGFSGGFYSQNESVTYTITVVEAE